MKRIVFFTCIFLGLQGCGNDAADTVFRGGHVYTVDADRSSAEAVAVADGRIVYVGTGDGIAAFIGPDTAVVDLQGGMLLPGFQDVHNHPIESGIEETILNFRGLSGIGEYRVAIAEYARANPGLPWVIGIGWLMSDFGPGAAGDRFVLDELVPDRPAFISSYDEHSAWVNSAALRVAGVDRDTPDPPGGWIERDAATGEPTGGLHEEARHLVKKHMPPETLEERIAALRYSQGLLNAWGITAIQDASVEGADELRTYRTLADTGELTLRSVAALSWYPDRGLEQIDELVELRSTYGGGLLDAGSVKIWQDGVMESHTAAMLQPYRTPGKGSGSALIDPEFLQRIVARLDAADFQVHVHAIGDAAVRQSLDAVDAALAENGQRGNRHHIAHLQLIDPADIPRFAKLAVIANFQPLWAMRDTYTDEVTIPELGIERSRWLYPIKSVLDAGGMIAFGSDWSVTTANPLPQIETAITRRDADDSDAEPLFAEEGIDLASAIAAFTINAAYVNRIENETGSIEVGKFADLVVLDRNLFDIRPDEISDTKVVLTMLGGRVVFDSRVN